MFGIGKLRKRVEALEQAERAKGWRKTAKPGDGIIYTIADGFHALAVVDKVTDEGVEVVSRAKIPWDRVFNVTPKETKTEA